MSSNLAASVDSDLAATDLGPLAWVLDELRKSLDGATKATRRFVRDAELALGSDIASLDASQLRIARQQLHQAVGALEMVGLRVPAQMLRTMETMVQRFVQRPELCSDEAATKLERASFALTEFLEGLVKGKHASAIALFPQYQAVAELAGVERVHPADLWSFDWRWLEVADLPTVAAQPYAVATREKMDWAILNIVKSANLAAAQRMAELSNGLACGQDRLQPRTFWAIASAYFEAFSAGAIHPNVHTKRAASRVLQQYATLSRGDHAVSERLAQDLLFFCATAQTLSPEVAPRLAAVRSTYGLDGAKPVDYETEQFGRYDPALLQMLRKRIASASETWSSLSGGDTHKLKLAGEQFAAVTDLMAKLHPESKVLAAALVRTVDSTMRRAAAPDPAVAMEVATTVLYLDAVYEDLDPTDSELAHRSARLAQRLDQVTAGGAPDPMETWMEELYRRVSDRQTMGSVVAELRGALGEIEKSLDAFFRNPTDKAPLREVPNHLAAMRGVFSVLGLDQPSTAALRMRAKVEQLLVDEVQQAAGNPVFEQLGNNLGAMGF
jgi:chemosensory pili system protein ChpA (sensor histidine kinase/response regulator)